MQIQAVGTELVQCVRIAEMIRRHGEQFLERVFTSNEIAHCCEQADSTSMFARRWAAKQAVFKALSCQNRGVRWTDIEIVPEQGGQHAVHLHRVAQQLASEQSVKKMHLSLGGCRTQAIAHVILCGPIP